MVDLWARQLVIHSVLYYGLANPLISDAEYDELTKKVVANFDDLSVFRRWQLGPREEVAATGIFLKVTVAAENAMVSLLQTKGITRKVYCDTAYRIDPKYHAGCRFRHPSEYRF